MLQSCFDKGQLCFFIFNSAEVILSPLPVGRLIKSGCQDYGSNSPGLQSRVYNIENERINYKIDQNDKLP